MKLGPVLFALIFSQVTSAGPKANPPTFSSKQLQKKIAECLEENCEDLKFLQSVLNLQNSLIDEKQKVQALTEEKRLLKEQIKPGKPYNEKLDSCRKTEVRKELLTKLGIIENGGLIYSKISPQGGIKASCWSNGRKRAEVTSTMCDFPLAITLNTRSGELASPIIRSVEYFFLSNGCDLDSVKIVEENSKTKDEFKLTYDSCGEKWKAVLTKPEAATDKANQSYLSLCFRYFLLPPRGSS